MTDEEACRELGRRMSRVTAVVGAACVLVGVAITGALFVALLQLQFHYVGEAELSLTIAAAALVGVGGCVYAGMVIRRVLLRARAPSWIAELADNQRQRREDLEQIVSLW